jgi:hypothetical protein
MAGHGRHEQTADAELTGDGHGVKRSCASVRNENEIAHIMPALNGDLSQCVRHRKGRNLDDSRRGMIGRQL